MSRLSVLGLLIWGLLIGGLASLNGSLLAFSLPLIAYLAVAAFTRPPSEPPDCQAQISPGSAAEGDPIGVRIRILPVAGRIEELRIRDLCPAALPVSGGRAGGLARLERSEPFDFEYRLTARRGLHHFPGVECVGSDPFALFPSRWLLPAERTVLVRPSYSTVRRISLRPTRTGVIAGAYPARSGGPGVEFYGLRKYAAGDPMRWVNWKASARRSGSLYINLFEQERVIDLGLIVDARRRSNAVAGGGSVYANSVAAAASLAELFLSQGNRVGLLIYGSHLDWTVPGYGRMQRERIMGALARTEEGESQVFNRIRNLPTRLFHSKSQLILLSPVLRADVGYLIQLRARRYPLLVISPDRDRLEAAALPPSANRRLAERVAKLEQQLITRSLANAGILRLVWDLSTPFEQLIELHLSRPQAWMRAIGAEA